jgi:hypothetical protein
VANTTYVAAYYTPNGKYADGYYGLDQGVTSGPLTVPASAMVGGNGVYYYGLGFPRTTSEASSYYVDVLFTPVGQPPVPSSPVPPPPVLSLTFEPPNPSTEYHAKGGPVATILPTWSNGQPFTGNN